MQGLVEVSTIWSSIAEVESKCGSVVNNNHSIGIHSVIVTILKNQQSTQLMTECFIAKEP
jgi:hypothetical protein